MTSTLYNLHTDGDQYRITKFVDGNPESSYLTTHAECQCPAGHRHTCRHRQMLPEMLAEGLENSHYFWDFDRRMAFDISGNAKHLLDALAATKPAPELTTVPEGLHGASAEDMPPLPEGVQMFNLAETSPAELFNAIAEAVGEPTHPTPAKPWRRI